MNKPLHRTLVLVCVLVGAGWGAFAQEDAAEYKVRIRGAKDGAVKKAIRHSAMTCKLRKRPPATLGQLRRRVEKDIPVIEAILKSRADRRHGRHLYPD